jgi:hypothetical protein
MNKEESDVHFDIDWGDGMNSVSGFGHTYAKTGTYKVNITSHDGSGNTGSFEFTVEVKDLSKKSSYSPWGSKLAVSSSAIPGNAFRSYFFNVKTFKTFVTPTVTERPYFSYPQDRLGGWAIDDHLLGAYWIGKFTFDKETSLKIDVSDPQWDVVRVYVNGIEITPSKNELEYVHRFSKGTHNIEIEYQTNWHAGTFTARLADEDEKYFSYEEALTEAYKVAGPAAQLVKQDAYSSEDQISGELSFSVVSTKTPKIVVLSSYDPVFWKTTSLKDRGVKAIVVASYAGASDVDNPGTIPVYRVRQHYDE